MAGSAPVIILGFLVHVASFALIFLSLPDMAAHCPTEEVSYFNPPSLAVALLCAVCLGRDISSPVVVSITMLTLIFYIQVSEIPASKHSRWLCWRHTIQESLQQRSLFPNSFSLAQQRPHFSPASISDCTLSSGFWQPLAYYLPLPSYLRNGR